MCRAWVHAMITLGLMPDQSDTEPDVTNRTQAEHALREREASLQDFLDNASDLIQSADMHGRFAYVNRAWREVLGYTTEEALQLTIFDIIDMECHEQCRQALRLLVEGSERADMELIFHTKSGRFIVVEGHLSLRTEKGRPILMRGFFRDVTSRREAEAALRRSRDELSLANAALERANRAKDEFLASMSHELRTPLNAVLGLSEALQEDAYGALSDKQRKAIKRIEESGRHLLALINDILDLSKIEAGKMTIEIRQVSVDDVCRASLRMIQEAAHKKRITVSLQIEQGADAIQADERRLKQILVNLLSNAVKFTPQGGAVGLEVSVEKASEGVRFTVWDTGIGIDSKDLSRLFRPFVQLDSSLARQHAGTGLGLALVRRLCDLHGGGLTVESEPGKGSRFSMVLSGVRELSLEESRCAPPMSVRGHVALLSRPPDAARMARILVAEDDETNVSVVVDFLETRGYDPYVARNGREAIDMARSMRPDLILMDIQMPIVDGLTAIREIRADATHEVSSVPIIAVTALAMSGDRERCLAAGADDYLSKPIGLRRLAEMIQEHLGSGAPSRLF